jgi:hypothetical protein
MPGPIIVSGQEAADNTDILQGTRLQTVPRGGYLTFELQASDNDATNNYTASVQLPNGDTPMNTVRIPCGNTSGLAGVIDDRTCLTATFPITQGGHCVFSVDETGDAELSWRVTYSPV